MSDEHKHILGLFEGALSNLRHDIFRMASLTKENVSNATKGLLERDNDSCNRAIADDEEVDTLEKQIDHEGMEIILRFSPVARDLRHVMATMKMSNNLERISDQAVNIAKRARKMNKHPELPETRQAEPLYTIAVSMLDDAIASFKDADIQKALNLEKRDDELDAAHKQFVKRLTRRGEKDPERVGGYINLIFIARFLERIGDRIVNIGEDCIYAESAMDIRHGGDLPEVK